VFFFFFQNKYKIERTFGYVYRVGVQPIDLQAVALSHVHVVRQYNTFVSHTPLHLGSNMYLLRPYSALSLLCYGRQLRFGKASFRLSIRGRVTTLLKPNDIRSRHAWHKLGTGVIWYHLKARLNILYFVLALLLMHFGISRSIDIGLYGSNISCCYRRYWFLTIQIPCASN